MILFLSLAAIDSGRSFKYLYLENDAYAQGAGNSDLIPFNSGAVFVNASALSFKRGDLEVSMTWAGNSFANNAVSLYSSKRLSKGSAAGNFSFLGSSDSEFDNGKVLYRASALRGAYSMLLEELIPRFRFPVSFAVSLAAGRETIWDESRAVFLMDFSTTAAFLNRKLFAAAALQNAGGAKGQLKTPLQFSAGVKYLLPRIKKTEMTAGLCYRADEFVYQRLSAGMSFLFSKKYSASFGTDLDLSKKTESLNRSLNLGFGFKNVKYGFDVSIVALTQGAVEYQSTFRYFYTSLNAHLSAEEIQLLDIERIIKMAKAAIRRSEYDYAFLLVKKGLVMEPGNEILTGLFRELRDRK